MRKIVNNLKQKRVDLQKNKEKLQTELEKIQKDSCSAEYNKQRIQNLLAPSKNRFKLSAAKSNLLPNSMSVYNTIGRDYFQNSNYRTFQST